MLAEMRPLLSEMRRLASLPTMLAVPASTPGVAAVLLAAGFLITHLAFLAPMPAGVDAVNFSLGVRDFNLSDHRPHPPGYPVFVALGKASRAVMERIAGPLPGRACSLCRRRETYALAMWSALFGAVAVFSLRQLFKAIGSDDRRAVAAAALTVTCPLFWFYGILPMSDISGLSAALAAQALTVTAWRRSRDTMPGARRLLILGAFIAGIAVGVRSQVTWLTLPLLSFVTIDHVRRARDGTLLYAAGAFITGALLWAIPLGVASGGPAAYLAGLTAQAGEDVSSGRMLAVAPDLAAAMHALIRMFAYPWSDKYVAVLVAGLATVGGIGLMVSARPAWGLLALSFGPYVVFHLLFQDATFLRYVLPVVPAVAYLAVCGLDMLARGRMVWVTAALTAVCVYLGMLPVLGYVGSGSPSLRALDAVRERLPQTEHRPVLGMHHAVSRVLRLENLPAPAVRAPTRHEWLELVTYWRSGGAAPVWFLAEPERTDLALIDPASRRLVNSYRLPLDRRFFLAGLRPSGVDWYEIDSPGWFAGEGWALTPETAGVASVDGRGPDRDAITAYVKRRPDAAVVMVGGRHLDSGGKAARVALSIDGRPIDSWLVGNNPGFFLRFLALPAGELDSADSRLDPPALRAANGSVRPEPESATERRYSRLQIHSVAADGSGAPVRTSIEQFDVQSADHVLFGFDAGWYEQEYDPAATRLSRWAGPNAALRIHHGGCDLMMYVKGQAPAGLLGGAVTIALRAADSVLSRVTVSGDFELRADVPARTLDRSGGLLTIESDRAFVPDVVHGNGDQRRLAIQVFTLRVEAATAARPVCGGRSTAGS